MKIAFLCPRFLWAGGGSVLFTRRLADEMMSRGHDVTIFTDRPVDQSQTEETLAFHGGPVKRLDRDVRKEKRALGWLTLGRIRGCYRLSEWLFRSGKTRLTAMGPVCPALDDPATFDGFDAWVLVNASSAWTIQLSRSLPRMDRLRKVVIPLFHPHEEISQYPVMASAMRHYHVVCGLTEFERPLVQGPARFVSIGAGSDPYPEPVDAGTFRQRYEIPGDAPVILFAGRKIYNKGVTHVIAAMETVWERHPDAWLVLVGFSHNPPEWLEAHLMRSAFAGERTVNLDDVSHQEREEALATCQVLAAPSISDSFGIVYLDAWRYAKPVIACRDSCAETFVEDGRNGRLVGFNQPEECASALLDLLGDPLEAAAMGERGRRDWQSSYQWSHVADRFEGALEDAPVGTVS